MDIENAATAMAALGHPARLDIYRRLVIAGSEGLNVGEISHATEIPLSTLFHHLTHLERGGLVEKARQGRETRCHPNFRMIRDLSAFLLEDCCRGKAGCKT